MVCLNRFGSWLLRGRGCWRWSSTWVYLIRKIYWWIWRSRDRCRRRSWRRRRSRSCPNKSYARHIINKPLVMISFNCIQSPIWIKLYINRIATIQIRNIGLCLYKIISICNNTYWRVRNECPINCYINITWC
jgi:hypothetical protein